MTKPTPDREAETNAEPEETAVTEVLAPAPEPVVEAEAMPVSATAPLPAPAPAPAPVEGPTIRWGALVWALLFLAIAGTTMWLLVSPERRDAVGDWLGSVHPLVLVLSGVIAVGVVIALFGIVGLIRRGERARRGHQAAGSSRSPSGVSSGGIGQASS
ncbi:hypothetical protein ACFOE1_04755 [Agromyces mediolanus]|uniref:Uncharacterized protein n=1 Tax=Agromyces mediolanus TaxID=41986 RepID=A0A918CKM2_AGRME|nr:hypothetical protein [Agromyces mediolanus]GGR29508.1 hypothetical protein GCM10010196_24320 [Agromyces mediolanus]GLJ72228.1 hypothetical protein GCM10017583_14840 [Agromyces mediolanus]